MAAIEGRLVGIFLFTGFPSYSAFNTQPGSRRLPWTVVLSELWLSLL